MKKRFNLIKNIAILNFRKLKSPYKIMFVLTYECNSKCRICKIWQTPRRTELDIMEIEKIFKRLKALCWLDLEGGEITLRKDLIEIVRTIIKNAKKLLLLHVSTNGQLPHNVFLLAKEILKSNVIPIINISIDGPKKINDELRGIEGSYLNSLETFKLLKKLRRGHCYLSCTLSDYNIGYIDELLSGLKNDVPDFSFSDLHFNIFHTSHYYKNQNIEGLSNLNFDSIKKYLKLCKNGGLIKRFLEDRYIKGLSEYLNGNRFPVKCQALGSSCFINPYGEVYPCGMHNRALGNLKDYDYDLNKLWNSAVSLQIGEDIKNKKCPGCWTPCEAFPSILGDLFNLRNDNERR